MSRESLTEDLLDYCMREFGVERRTAKGYVANALLKLTWPEQKAKQAKLG